jgi:uncharacterized small protein (DUF1192 family)
VKNMIFKTVGNLLIAVHSENNMSDEEARVCNEALRGLDLDRLRVLVCTEGGGATATQRRALVDAYGGREPKTAIVSASWLVRGPATALSWFNKNLKAFSNDDIEGALRYLDIADGRIDFVIQEVARMRRELKQQSAVRGAANM